MLDSVRLSSFESFLVTLPPISSTWKMSSWAVCGSSVFCGWLFLVLLGFSLETAANFLLFLNVAMMHDAGEKVLSNVKIELNLLFFFKFEYLLLLRGKSFNKSKLLMTSKISVIPKATKLYNNTSTFVSPIYVFSLAGFIKVYTPNQATNRDKYFNHIIYKREMLPLAEINTCLSLFSFMDRVFSIFRRKNYWSNPSETDIKEVIPAPTQ